MNIYVYIYIERERALTYLYYIDHLNKQNTLVNSHKCKFRAQKNFFSQN